MTAVLDGHGPAALALNSIWMLGTAIVLVVGAELAGVAVRARVATEVALPPRSLFRAVLDETWMIRVPKPVSKGREIGRFHESGRRSQSGVVLLASLVVGFLGAVVLVLSGHVPDHGFTLLAALIAVGLAGAVAVPSLVAAWKNSALSLSATRSVVSALIAEASLVAALVVSLAVVARSQGLTAVSLLEAAAIAACTTLAVRMGPLPRGLVTADIVFVVPLTWIGVPLPVALVAVVVWRLGSIIVFLLALTPAAASRIQRTRKFGRESKCSHPRVLRGRTRFLPPHRPERLNQTVSESMTSILNDCESAESPSSTPAVVRTAQRSEANYLASLHLHEFPLSLYARMGERFMTALYRQWIGARGSSAMVASLDGVVVGYAVGKHGSYRCRTSDLVVSTFVGIGALIIRPNLWKRAILLYGRMLRRKCRGDLRSPDSELAFIAVEATRRNQGVGSVLLEAFEMAARGSGTGRCTLVTEQENNVARTFYAHRQWREVGTTQSADGRALVRLEICQEGA